MQSWPPSHIYGRLTLHIAPKVGSFVLAMHSFLKPYTLASMRSCVGRHGEGTKPTACGILCTSHTACYSTCPTPHAPGMHSLHAPNMPSTCPLSIRSSEGYKTCAHTAPQPRAPCEGHRSETSWLPLLRCTYSGIATWVSKIMNGMGEHTSHSSGPTCRGTRQGDGALATLNAKSSMSTCAQHWGEPPQWDCVDGNRSHGRSTPNRGRTEGKELMRMGPTLPPREGED